MKFINALLAFSSLLPIFVQSQFLDPIKVAKQQSASKLPPCRLCTVFVESFKKVTIAIKIINKNSFLIQIIYIE